MCLCGYIQSFNTLLYVCPVCSVAVMERKIPLEYKIISAIKHNVEFFFKIYNNRY